MFAHFTQGSNDLPRAIRFYDALLAALNIKRRESADNVEIVCYQGNDTDSPGFFVCIPFDDKPASVGNGAMVAFRAENKSQVDNSYQAGMANGGTDEGPPGERPHYAKGYYGAYLRDPDGNKIHIVFRGDKLQA